MHTLLTGMTHEDVRCHGTYFYLSMRFQHVPLAVRACRSLRTTGLAILLFTVQWAPAQVVVNEVCTRNRTVYEDANGGHPDWVEIRNAGTEPVYLGDHYLSDRIMDLGKWRLPDVELAPGGYLLLLSGEEGDDDHRFPFGLAGEGETVFLSGPGLQIVSQLEAPPLRSDHSCGLANGTTMLFDIPTPGAPNNTPGYPGYASTPLPTIQPGRVPRNSSLDLIAGPGCTVHWTIDGRDALPGSPAWSGPVPLTATMVIKAIATRPGYLPSDLFAGTYLVDTGTGLPVISITVHPDSLWDWDRGLYVMGPAADTAFPYRGANFWRNDHIPAHFEYFDEEGRLGLSQRVDLRMHGGSQARTKPQRPFRITARKRYGNGLLEYPFFPERGSLEQYKQLVLRNSSGDFCLSNFRDGLWHQVALHKGLDIDVLAFRPVRMYLNGTYWGWMNLRERINLEMIAYDFGADPDSILLMVQENTSSQGDTMHFHDLQQFITQQDLNNPAHWAHVEALLDIPSLKDYFALEIFAGNVDWPANNVRYWKPSPTTGKWRYILHDLDATMNVFGWIGMDIDMFWLVLEHRAGWMHSEVFRGLLGNDEFKRTFINRLADLMNTTFSEERFMEEVTTIRQELKSEVAPHYGRWNCDPAAWDLHANDIIPSFARVRQDHVRQHVRSHFDLPGVVALDFEVFPASAGSIDVNTITPELPFTGRYFTGNAIDLVAHEAPGYRFDHWRFPDGTRVDTPRTTWSFGTDGPVIAHFRSLNGDLLAFPNPTNGEVELAIWMEEAGTVTVNVMDLHGSLLSSSSLSLGEGSGRVRLDLSDQPAGVHVLRVGTPSGIHCARVVRTGR